MKLPDFLADTYQRYKRDTTRVATWLAETSQACGYSSSLPNPAAAAKPSGPRLKGRLRKEAKVAVAEEELDTPKHVLPLHGFVPRAESIANFKKAPVKVPLMVQLAAEAVVKARKECSSFYKNQATSKGAENCSNGNHQYMILVLEKALKILRPCFLTATSAEQSKPKLAVRETNISNTFSHLEIEEEKEENDKDSSTTSGGNAGRKKTTNMSTRGHKRQQGKTSTPKEDIYEIADSEDNGRFAVFCLLEDFRSLRVFIQGIWKQYGKSSLDLLSATVITNTALEFASRAEEDFCARYPQFKDYESVIHFTFPHAKLLSKQNLEEDSNGVIYEGLESMYFFCFEHLRICRKSQSFAEGKIALVMPERGKSYDPTVDWASLPPYKKRRHDAILLREVLPQWTLLLGLSMETDLVPTEDELIKGLRKLISTGLIPGALAFSLQIFLDIHHVLGRGVYRPYWDFCSSGGEISDALETYPKVAKRYKLKSWPEDIGGEVKRLVAIIRAWTKEDLLMALRYKGQLERGVVPNTIWPRKKHHLLKLHPLMCGVYLLSFCLRMQRWGLRLLKATGWVQHAAHLYNSVRQEEDLDQAWGDMEYLITIQGPGDVFIGDRPTNRESF